MKTLHSLIIILFTSFGVNSCDKAAEGQPAVAGEWKLVEVNKNDHWGAPLYWKEVDSNETIRFTANGEYLRKENSKGYTLVGNYKVKDGQIEIVPVGGEKAKIYLEYKIENSQLVLGTGSFEGIVAKRFSPLQRE